MAPQWEQQLLAAPAPGSHPQAPQALVAFAATPAAAPPGMVYAVPQVPTAMHQHIYQLTCTYAWLQHQAGHPGLGSMANGNVGMLRGQLQEPSATGTALAAQAGTMALHPRESIALAARMRKGGHSRRPLRSWQQRCKLETVYDEDEEEEEEETTCSSSSADEDAVDARGRLDALEPLSLEMTKLLLADEASASESVCSTVSSTAGRAPKQRKAPAQRKEALHRVQGILQRTAQCARQLQSGRDARSAALKELQGIVWHLSMDSEGCRLVQIALEQARGPERALLVEELHGHVREGMGSPHANHVLQKVIATMTVEIAGFIAQELSGIAAEASRHRYGCRVLCRLVEQFGSSACVTSLLDEMMQETSGLIQHNFGRHVVQSVLEHGGAAYRHAIANELAEDIQSKATHRNASYVIESALSYCNDSDVTMLAAKIGAGDVMELLQDQFGMFVLRSLMHLPKSLSAAVADQIAKAPAAVQQTKHYRRLQDLLKADQDFDENEEDDEEDEDEGW